MLDNDILVVTQKIVSKAEGRLVPIDASDPLSHKQLVEQEAVRIVRRRGDLIITETKHGFVCANSGIDLSNIEKGYAALLPIDSDKSARR
ncbi:F420-0--gamma-glutamyl ligase, partial [bacterium]|nr:F420-0--gamma-glutamyl ligase [bacterium]